jgi:hypothetical protein
VVFKSSLDAEMNSTPYNALTSQEMQISMKNLHDQLRNIQKQRDRVKVRLAALVDREGATVNEHLNSDLQAIMECELRKQSN